jgi:ubiquitin-like modifier-activating enzyme ATG7
MRSAPHTKHAGQVACPALVHRCAFFPDRPPQKWNNHSLPLQAVKTLDALVKEADVVFMLTDSRESRWLPSVLAAAHGTLLVNAALGFDSWVVMRHGRGTTGMPAVVGVDTPVATPRLGCYFCNDVIAPANSAAGRSMDEQCTVVRPGLARIAAAHAVELVAVLSQHTAWIDTPAVASGHAVAAMGASAAAEGALGGAPHMLRGCLTGFSQTCMTGHANEYCSACSRGVVDAYLAGGPAFVRQVAEVRLAGRAMALRAAAPQMACLALVVAPMLLACLLSSLRRRAVAQGEPLNACVQRLRMDCLSAVCT